ncbi:MAG: enoyl-CoA hydratase/isomerase family protein [Chloroflexota bacterium]
MAYKYVVYEKQGNVATVTLNKPETLNRFVFVGRGEDAQELDKALDEGADDDDVKVIIIKGAGRSFCAGGDLTQVGFIYGMGSGEPGERRPSQRVRLKLDRKGYDAFLRQLLNPKLTIAQVHGHCLGGGLYMALYCDYIIAAEDAKLGCVEQRLGFAGSGTPVMPLLIARIGLTKTLDLILTGRTISGKEAADMGLINKAVPADKLEEEVNKVAGAFSLLPRDGIAIGKAHRHMMYERLGLLSGFSQGYLTHTMFTNCRWEADEYSFFKERRDKGAKAAFHGRDERYVKLE